MKKLSVFNTNFQNLFQDVVYYRMSNLWLLKCGIPFKYKAKFEKKPLLFRSKIGIFNIIFKRMYKELKTGN